MRNILCFLLIIFMSLPISGMSEKEEFELYKEFKLNKEKMN